MVVYFVDFYGVDDELIRAFNARRLRRHSDGTVSFWLGFKRYVINSFDVKKITPFTNKGSIFEPLFKCGFLNLYKK